ncbi:alpha/beta fold hydrolase [Rhizobium rhizogenes]|uniref:alpha/beta fold hydrolase n=1 Tax=Rhizobium rhizogenes TaxID=359 RepID=UPI001571DC01|nr:alpha/beta fold hydrolase [Rhizobium rhizogenes]NTF97930.1 alpha/beta hydrolase [Rhizobium rhizogenes]
MINLERRIETADKAELLWGGDVPTAGTALVLAHAHTGTASGFTPLLRILHRPALVWNRRGYGGSTRGTGYSHITQEEDLLLLLDHLRLMTVDLVGLAAGGACMAAFAARWPQRVHRLVLISSFLGQTAEFWQTATGHAAVVGAPADKELSPAFRASPDAVGWIAAAEVNRLARAGEPQQPCSVSLCDLQPVRDLHIWTGAEDRLFTPAMLRHSARLLPHAATAVMPAVAHAAPVENPALVARWLARLDEGKDLSFVSQTLGEGPR